MSEPASKRWPTSFTAVGRDDNLGGKVGAGFGELEAERVRSSGEEARDVEQRVVCELWYHRRAAGAVARPSESTDG